MRQQASLRPTQSTEPTKTQVVATSKPIQPTQSTEPTKTQVVTTSEAIRTTVVKITQSTSTMRAINPSVSQTEALQSTDVDKTPVTTSNIVQPPTTKIAATPSQSEVTPTSSVVITGQ